MGRVGVGTEFVRHCPSDSRPGVTYTQRKLATGEWSCDCPGFQHRESCKHVLRILVESERSALLRERERLSGQARELKDRVREINDRLEELG